MTITTAISPAHSLPDHRASIRRAWLAMNKLAPTQGVFVGGSARGETRTRQSVLSTASQA